MRFHHQDTQTPRFGGTYLPVSPAIDGLAKEVVDAAFKVHSTLGPGLLESVVYEDVRLDAGLRIDLVVENRLIVEIKAVETMPPVFEAQLLTYLKLTKMRLGLLINFNVSKIKDGIKRIIL